ncbi:MAG: hypothetical protein COB53_05895 [Elusimicrobia bacterium]|nr:MAG: hypothetical protein COB53_05895 [Elusimicrobiota bacterium]
MAGFLDKFRKTVVASVWKEESDQQKPVDIDDKIALGVLLWIVAEADSQFLPEEEEQIKQILHSFSHISKTEIPLVLAAVSQAAKERVDMHAFTRELKANLPYDARKTIIEELFRVACADKNLDALEMETIRKIADLFFVSHKDLIAAKLKVKEEFGLRIAAGGK